MVSKKSRVEQGGIDAYAAIDFGDNPTAKTKSTTVTRKSRDKSLMPIWAEQLWLPVYVPTMSNAVRITLMDYDKIGANETVSSLHMDFQYIQTNFRTQRLKSSPRWYNTCVLTAGLR